MKIINTSKHIVIGKFDSKVISFSVLLFLVSCNLFFVPLALAGPQSTTYEIKSYDFGSGGISGDTSTTYSLFGNTGQVDGTSLNSTTYTNQPGLTYELAANVPGAPTLAIPANNYDRMQITLNTSSNPSDTTYAIQASTTSNFSSNIFYVKTDDTLGTTLASTDYQTNAIWGASGFFVTGLTGNTTYYFRVKARQGNYTETGWGPSSSQTTGTSSLSFSLDSNAITFANLNSGNSYTDSAKSTVLTTSTNAYNGYTIYGWDTQALTTTDGSTISNYSSPNSSPTTWSGTGFGYTTSDTALSGGTPNRFVGSKYAGFTTTGPGDPVADNPGPVLNSQISNETFTISYRITGDNTTPAGTYTNTILYSIVPSY